MSKANKNNNNQNKGDTTARKQRLLTMAFTAGNTEVSLNYARQVLDIDPNDPDALLITADFTEDEHKREELLLSAINFAEKADDRSEEDKEILLLGLYQRLAFSLFSLEKYEESLKLIEEKIFTANPEYAQYLAVTDTIKNLYYRTLIQVHDWKKILAFSMKDDENSLGRAYARLIATFMLSPNQNRSVCAKMFWDALILGTDVPFYILGYLEEPNDDDSPKKHEEFNFAVMFFDILSISDEFFRWFARGSLLFGLLSGRMDSEYEKMIEILESLDGLEEYEAMNKILIERDDIAVIEMLAAHKCLAR